MFFSKYTLIQEHVIALGVATQDEKYIYEKANLYIVWLDISNTSVANHHNKLSQLFECLQMVLNN